MFYIFEVNYYISQTLNTIRIFKYQHIRRFHLTISNSEQNINALNHKPFKEGKSCKFRLYCLMSIYVLNYY